jgi:hypothetical protein
VPGGAAKGNRKFFRADATGDSDLLPGTEVSDPEMVLREDFTAETETPDLFFIRARGYPPGAEKFGWLVFFQLVRLVVRALLAVLAADLPVLFRIFGHIRWAV